ncbi:MAG: hypothetical protein BIFFINMI_03252 [Phycisphaerae bacterium]|nr:hypothetical protein [Phycisphaerae bacterium]
MHKTLIALLLGLAAAAAAHAADAPTTVPDGEQDLAARTAAAIAREATLGNAAEVGCPLPLAGHWNTGQYSRAAGMDPDFQMTLIQGGHHLLPWFQLNAPWWDPMPERYYESAMKLAARLRLPLTFVGTQFEAGLTDEKKFFDLPPDANPNVVGPDGQVGRRVSPFGPVEPWRQVGREWTDRDLVRKLQQWYPNPPRVVFLSNNEHAKLTWKDAEQSKRYLDRFDQGRDDAFKRSAVADGWVERYHALQAGMRDGLTSPAWRKGATFVGYDAFGPAHLARWGGWAEYSLWKPGRIDPSPLIWDGGSPSYYVNNWSPVTDHTVWSPQVESMNWPFMLDQAFRLNPDFWWEISVWDGYEPTQKNDQRKFYADHGQTYGPPRYLGYVQFGMWLLRPRVVREFRGWTDRREDMLPYFTQILAAVDRVWDDATLTEFWRKGTLVPNRSAKHPYQDRLPEELKDVDRWFLLDTSLTPPRPWKLVTPIPVFAMALVLGEAPARRWLLYAHAPTGDREDARITLPGYGDLSADVPVAGTFLLVDEKAKSVRPLGRSGE